MGKEAQGRVARRLYEFDIRTAIQRGYDHFNWEDLNDFVTKEYYDEAREIINTLKLNEVESEG